MSLIAWLWSSKETETYSLPHVVHATLKFADENSKTEFETMATGESGLTKIRQSNGCRLIECLSDLNDPLCLVIRQEWDSQSDHDAYYQTRVEDGVMDVWKTLESLETYVEIAHYEFCDL